MRKPRNCNGSEVFLYFQRFADVQRYFTDQNRCSSFARSGWIKSF
nr:MAG TPA: hypothetical protein [Caudoviricetes sp.]